MNDDLLLRNAVYNTFLEAERLTCKSVSVPAISSGIFGFPKPRCAEILFDTAEEFLFRNDIKHLNEIRFTNFDEETYSIFMEEFKKRYTETSG